MSREFCFDHIIDRHNTRSCKWDELDFLQDPKGELDLIHLGVADMDFEVAPCITDYFKTIVDHGIYGYAWLQSDFAASICEWNRSQYDVDIDPEWIVFVPRITTSAHMCVRLFTSSCADVVAQVPLYTPLQEAITMNGRQLVANPLIHDSCGQWKIDFEQLTGQSQAEMLLLCDPHNPTGRCFNDLEVRQLAEIAEKNDWFVFVDEIHADLLSDDVRHYSMLNRSQQLNQKLIIASSLTKSFNIPGIIVSWLIVPNRELRERIRQEVKLMGMNNPTSFAAGVVPVAYGQGKDWLNAVNSYISANEDYTRTFFAENFPQLKIAPREGTYLLWIDFSELNVSDEQFQNWFLHEVGVEVYFGKMAFGYYGKKHIRLNIATPRELLTQAYTRMANHWQW